MTQIDKGLNSQAKSPNLCSNFTDLLRKTTLGGNMPRHNWILWTVSMLFVLNTKPKWFWAYYHIKQRKIFHCTCKRKNIMKRLQKLN